MAETSTMGSMYLFEDLLKMMRGLEHLTMHAGGSWDCFAQRTGSSGGSYPCVHLLNKRL